MCLNFFCSFNPFVTDCVKTKTKTKNDLILVLRAGCSFVSSGITHYMYTIKTINIHCTHDDVTRSVGHRWRVKSEENIIAIEAILLLYCVCPSVTLRAETSVACDSIFSSPGSPVWLRVVGSPRGGDRGSASPRTFLFFYNNTIVRLPGVSF